MVMPAQPLTGRGSEALIASSHTVFAQAPPAHHEAQYNSQLSQHFQAPTLLILGIESSCDETGVALYDSEKGLISHRLHTQVEMHAA
ncbi:MAG: hypothetical protein WCL29_03035, partial [Pseudomonadota bacterium]